MVEFVFKNQFPGSAEAEKVVKFAYKHVIMAMRKKASQVLQGKESQNYNDLITLETNYLPELEFLKEITFDVMDSVMRREI